MTEWAPSPSVRSLIRGDALVAALGDDVGGAELEGQLLAGFVAAHRDDALGAELLGGEHAEEADGAVADDGHGLARARPRRRRPRTSRCRVRRRRPGSWGTRSSDGTSGVATSVPSASGIRAYSAWVPMVPIGLAVDAGALVAGPADLAGVVGGEERADDELAGLDRADVAADLLDDSAVLVTHGCRPSTAVDAAVRPQVGAADAGRGESDDGVGGLDDLRVGAVLDADVAGGVQDGSSHRSFLSYGGEVSRTRRGARREAGS